MTYYPTTRQASPQAWRRLRKTMTDGELRDIAFEIAAIVEAEENSNDLTQSISYALLAFPWGDQSQA